MIAHIVLVFAAVAGCWAFPPLAPPCCPEFRAPKCCPSVCTDIYEPICATDCNTYATFPNQCYLDKFNCDHRIRGWRKVANGRCPKHYPLVLGGPSVKEELDLVQVLEVPTKIVETVEVPKVVEVVEEVEVPHKVIEVPHKVIEVPHKVIEVPEPHVPYYRPKYY